MAASLEGVADVRRRGKYLVVVFESGRHLLDTPCGRPETSCTRRQGAPGRSTRAGCRPDWSDGSDVVYRDVRRFGTWDVLEPGELDDYFASRRLGVEPLARGFTAARLGRSLAGRRAPVKAASSTRRRLPGLGTSMPTRRCGTPASIRSCRRELDAEEVASLRGGIRKALRLGIRRQGATLRDHRSADGSRGTILGRLSGLRAGGKALHDRCGNSDREDAGRRGDGAWYCPVRQPHRRP